MAAKHTQDMQIQGAEHISQISELNLRISKLKEEYDGLAPVLEAKTRLEKELSEVMEALEKEKREHTVQVSALERRNVMEKERLKKEMLRKIRETKLSLLAMTEDQLHTTTKRTIMENEQMTTELQYQSKETERIVKLNNKLVKENKSMRRQMELHEQSQAMLVKRAKKFQNMITRLNSDLAVKQKEHAALKKSEWSSDPARALVETQQTIRNLERQTADLEELLQASQEEIQMIQNQLEDTRRATATMLGVQNESLSFVLMCFEDVKLKFAKARMGTGPPIGNTPFLTACAYVFSQFQYLLVSVFDRASQLSAIYTCT